jgi:ribosomal protein L16 Arg81 hydroxylase
VHWDPPDVLAVQVVGRKTWRLYGPTREAPLVRDFTAAPAPEGDPHEVHELRAGQALFFGPGDAHDIRALEESALLLTLSMVDDE